MRVRAKDTSEVPAERPAGRVRDSDRQSQEKNVCTRTQNSCEVSALLQHTKKKPWLSHI